MTTALTSGAADLSGRPVAVSLTLPAPSTELGSAGIFAVATAGFAMCAALLAGCAPVGLSVAIVFLFAGPHNFFELRYFLSRVPSRLGPLRGFFLLAAGGLLCLFASHLCLTWLARQHIIEPAVSTLAYGGWNTLFILWAAGLVHNRSLQPPKRDWSLVWPAAFLCIGLNWLGPAWFGLALIYAHPLVGLWMLDRELQRKPDWRKAYRLCLAALPLLIAVMWCQLARSTPIDAQDFTTWQITNQAGAGLLTGISSHLLVSTHAFLEMLHYGVWLVGIPLLTMGISGGRFKPIPAARRSIRWQGAVTGALALSAFGVMILWAAFLTDYATTRDIYFLVAIAHVLAEIPFLLRAL